MNTQVEVDLAEMYARKMHKNQMYGTNPYTFHLEMVVMILKIHGFDSPDLFIGAWLHDVIEDQNIPKEALIALFGDKAFNMIRACTDPKGLPNRKERKIRVYKKLQEFPEAIPIKLADRIANMMMSKFNRPDKFKMYMKEHNEFVKALGHPYTMADGSMWKHLDSLART